MSLNDIRRTAPYTWYVGDASGHGLFIRVGDMLREPISHHNLFEFSKRDVDGSMFKRIEFLKYEKVNRLSRLIERALWQLLR